MNAIGFHLTPSGRAATQQAAGAFLSLARAQHRHAAEYRQWAREAEAAGHPERALHWFAEAEKSEASSKWNFAAARDRASLT